MVDISCKKQTLEFRWTVSRGRDTYGYNICTLYVDGVKRSRCNGGGYDMEGTCLGHFIASAYASRLNGLKEADMPEHSHWESDDAAFICRNSACLAKHIHEDRELVKLRCEDWEKQWPKCPECGEEMSRDHRAGKRIHDGRYMYGLTFHDPNYDPSKAVIGKDCHDRTLGDGAKGKTVEQAEAQGQSFGLERYEAFYKASSKVPTERHTVPSIDGGCGKSSVEKIAAAVGLTFEYVGTSNGKQKHWIMRDFRAGSM